jgi:hypothetical protein
VTSRHAVASAAADIASRIDAANDPGQSAKAKCEAFSCES